MMVLNMYSLNNIIKSSDQKTRKSKINFKIYNKLNNKDKIRN